MSRESKIDATSIEEDSPPVVVKSAILGRLPITTVTRNPADKINDDGFFASDVGGEDTKVDWYSRMAIKDVDKARDYKALTGKWAYNFYRPCPLFHPCKLKERANHVHVKVYPQGDCPRVADLVEKASLRLPIHPQLFGKGQVLVKEAKLMSYKTKGLHYPTRLYLENGGIGARLPMYGPTGPVTTFDKTGAKPVGYHIEPDEEGSALPPCGVDLGSVLMDKNRAAWFARLSHIDTASDYGLSQLRPWAGEQDPDVVGVRIRSPGFLEWIVGHCWQFLWHGLVEHWAQTERALDATLPVPDQESGLVPVYTPDLEALLRIFKQMSGKYNTVPLKGATNGLELCLVLGNQSAAYEKLRRERKQAKQEEQHIEFDEHRERFQPCFEMLFTLMDVIHPEEKDAEAPDNEDIDIDEEAMFAGGMRPLRGTL